MKNNEFWKISKQAQEAVEFMATRKSSHSTTG
jgi:hypothetical protein